MGKQDTKTRSGYKLGCGLYFLGILLCMGEAGYLTADLGRLLGAMLCGAGLLLVVLPRDLKQWCILVISCWLISWNVPFACYHLGISFVLLALLRRTTGRAYEELFIPTSVLFVVETLFYFCPQAALACSVFTQWLTKTASGWFPRPAILGESPFGLFPMLILISLFYVLLKSRLSFASRVGGIVGLAVIWGLANEGFNCYLSSSLQRFSFRFPVEALPHYYQPPTLAEMAFYIPLVLFVLGFVILWTVRWPNELPPKGPNLLSPRIGKTYFWAIVCVAFLVSVGTVVHQWLHQRENKDEIAFLDSTFADFKTPNFTMFGNATSGMFGLWERGLVTSGFKVVHIPHITDIPRELKLLVIINPKNVSDADTDTFRNYLEKGGNVLLLGDHTDLSGTMEAINKLLIPLGAQWRFDSGFCIGSEWTHKYEWCNHPITQGFDEYDEIFQQSTGATIDLFDLRWKPIVTGKYIFSDIGNRLNTNAFLGNYSYEPGEILGNLCVVAERHVGRGKLIAFGDTSAFQNISIAHSWPFIERVGRYLTQGPVVEGRWLESGLLVGVCILLALGRLSWVILATCLSAVMGLASLCSQNESGGGPWPDLPKAYIDVAHANNLTLEHWRAKSVDGLLINCYRNGFWPVICHDRFKNRLSTRDIYICVSPRSPLTASEWDYLMADTKEGARMLLAFGIREVPNLPLPESFGCRVRNMPLGPVPVRPKLPVEEFANTMNEPQFSEAWPLEVTGNGWRALYRWKDYTVVAERQLGRGKVICLGDPQFLWDKGLESEKDAWVGNILFLRDILSQSNSVASP